MIRSSLRNLVIACAVLGPAELSSQVWRTSWLDYSGTVDGSFNATCPNNAGTPVPRAGKVSFTFNGGGSDAKTNVVSQWYPTSGPRTSRFGQITADGGVSGNQVQFFEGGTFAWSGQFKRGSDGSVEASGAISPQPGDKFGCTGTWRAGTAAAVPLTNKADCAQYRARIRNLDSERFYGLAPRDLYSDLQDARRFLHYSNGRVAGIKNRTLTGSLAEEQKVRSDLYAEVNRLAALHKKALTIGHEIQRLESEARSAGCAMEGSEGAPNTDAARDRAIDQLVGLDSPKNPPRNPSAKTIDVAGVRGSVEVETLGSRGSPRAGSPIPLSEPVTIRTGPGSSVTIQVGSVRKTLQPNTTIRIVPKSTGQPDVIIERGAATVDVRKPVATQIQTQTATTDVGGTVFTVSYDATTGVTGVMVEEGRVTVRSRNPSVRGVTLTPGEYVEVGRNTMTAVLPAPGAPETRGDVTSAGPDTRRNPIGTTQSIDLTGLWRDDTGGGAVYRLRQVGNWLYWLVDGTPKGSYVNISYGQISGNTITGMWVDMPGSPTLSGGTLTLRIESNDRLVKVGTSGYGAQAWIRVSSAGGSR